MDRSISFFPHFVFIFLICFKVYAETLKWEQLDSMSHVKFFLIRWKHLENWTKHIVPFQVCHWCCCCCYWLSSYLYLRSQHLEKTHCIPSQVVYSIFHWRSRFFLIRSRHLEKSIVFLSKLFSSFIFFSLAVKFVHIWSNILNNTIWYLAKFSFFFHGRVKFIYPS